MCAAISFPAVHELVPDELLQVGERLARAGHRAWLTGEGLHARIFARRHSAADIAPVAALAAHPERPPSDCFEVVTSARFDEILGCFPSAVVVADRPPVAVLPTAAGPVDLTPLRHGDLRSELARRDFTVRAMALELTRGADALLDPFDGAADLAARTLRAVGSAQASLAAAPARALEAARLVARYGYEVDAELERALADCDWQSAPPPIPRARVGRLLLRIVAGAHAARAVALLRATGLEAALLPGARADVADRLDDPALATGLAERMALWLRDTSAEALLPEHRIQLGLARRVRKLLADHPLDAQIRTNPARTAARLRKKHDSATLAWLFALREAEAAALDVDHREAVHRKLRRLRGALDRAEQAERRSRARVSLALDGRAVMEILECRPGPRVGEAVAHLARCVAEDPSLNEREALVALLRDWSARSDD